MRNVFIKVVDNNHLECIDYLVSLGGKNLHAVVNPEADSYSIDPCGTLGWMDNYNWYIEEGYTEVFLPEAAPSKRHPHYDLIVQWASDVSQKVWWSSDKSVWTETKNPTWVSDYHYHIGETPPPNLEPVLFEDVCKGVVYYVAHPTSIKFYYQFMYFFEDDKHLFDRKLAYNTPEGAIKRTKEMLGMTD